MADNETRNLRPYLSGTGAWALALGTSIGWGSLVVTSNTYLLKAGPLGSSLGMIIGAIVMIIISRNYHYMMNCIPEAGGAYAFVRDSFGYDHGFVAACFTRFQKIMYFRHVSRVYQRMACHTGRCSLLRSFPASYRLSEEQQSDG